MALRLALWLTALVLASAAPKPLADSGSNADLAEALQFLALNDQIMSGQTYLLSIAQWDYDSNLTEHNKDKMLEQNLIYAKYHKESWKNATSFAWKEFEDEEVKRRFKFLTVLGPAALTEEKLKEYNQLVADMSATYSIAKICPYNDGMWVNEKFCNLTLEPDIQEILRKSHNYDELTHVWKAFRDKAGKPIKDKYLRYVELSNEMAKLNGFPDRAEMLRENYESDDFEGDVEKLWLQVRPLYVQIHAYVRRQLINQFGRHKINAKGPIPAHILGNMWGQQWGAVDDFPQPYPDRPTVDVTANMVAKNMTVLQMFKISEEFFTSLGLLPMPEEFWQKSIIEKPKDREIICHASAWDFSNGKDFRIKQCSDITMEDLVTTHHEMGHIEYFLQYAHQPLVFRESANPGFHEAIGDIMELSVSTPEHLKSIGLLDKVSDDPEGDINFLMSMALKKIAFLPSALVIDVWRWGVYNGSITAENMNRKWWDLRLKYQGLCPPVQRTEEDFDPGAKYHVPAGVPYIRYFISHILQFQFHKYLCEEAGYVGPLHKCDIYRSKAAGSLLRKILQMGSSKHWSEAIKILTKGKSDKVDAQPVLDFFEPLMSWLVEKNQEEELGWCTQDPTICPPA